MKKITLLAALLLALTATSAFAIGAIAVDDQAGDKDAGYGWATGYATKEEAFEAALAECKKAGNANCQSKVWFAACGAYASNANYYGIGWGPTKAAAEQKAMGDCAHSDCKIHVSACE